MLAFCAVDLIVNFKIWMRMNWLRRIKIDLEHYILVKFKFFNLFFLDVNIKWIWFYFILCQPNVHNSAVRVYCLFNYFPEFSLPISKRKSICYVDSHVMSPYQPKIHWWVRQMCFFFVFFFDHESNKIKNYEKHSTHK